MVIPFWQRFLAPLVYLLPWSDAIPLGLGPNGLFMQYPILRPFILPAIPIIQLEQSVPFGLGGLLLFFILFLSVVRNPNVPYFLRFNTLQALLTDIVLIILSFAFSILIQPLGSSLLLTTLSSTVVIAVLSILIFSLVESLRGRETVLPGISQAARMQLF